jgi:hypothetical protein
VRRIRPEQIVEDENSVPRDHHFIPVFLLKQWAAANGKLVEYTIKRHKLIAKPVGPRSTGFEVDLYAFDELPPDVRQFVEEEFFNYADNIAAIALERLLAGDLDDWSSELKSGWSRFVIGIHLHTLVPCPSFALPLYPLGKATAKPRNLRMKPSASPNTPPGSMSIARSTIR